MAKTKKQIAELSDQSIDKLHEMRSKIIQRINENSIAQHTPQQHIYLLAKYRELLLVEKLLSNTLPVLKLLQKI